MNITDNTKVWEIESQSVNHFDLDARYDSRKSFYGKAKVYVMKDGTQVLVSYSTIVSIYKDGKVTHFGKWSQTTTRHQREFERQYA